MQCKKCLMDTEVSEIRFDEEGVCNFCRTWEKNEAVRKEEMKNFESKILPKIARGFIIGLSGGVDSSWCLHRLVEMGFKPKMAFSMDNGWNYPLADENVMRMVETLGIPLYRYVLDIEKFKKVQKAYIDAGVINIEAITDHVLMAVSYEMARQQGVKCIVGGGNHSGEGIMPESWSYRSGDLKNLKAIGGDIDGLPTCSLWKFNIHKWWHKIEIVNLPDYFEYNREEAKKILIEKYKWNDYGEKHCESIFTQWFQNHYLLDKWGIDKRKAHLSSLINAGQMTKEEAEKEIKITPEWKEEKVVFPYWMRYNYIMKIPKKSHYDFPNNEKLYKFICRIIKWSKNLNIIIKF